MSLDRRINGSVSLPDLLRDLRKKRGLVLKQVAEACGVSISFLSQLERRVKTGMTREMADQISAFYNLDPDEFWLLVERNREQGQPQRTIYVTEPFPDISRVVGREREKSQILDILAVDPPQFPIIAITGIAGIGKSTLAAMVCNNITGFKNLWYTFSADYSPDHFLAKIVRDISGQSLDGLSYTQEIDLFLNLLTRERTLLVMNSLEEWLDHRDKVDKAEKLLTRLSDCDIGSSAVILTSRVFPKALHRRPFEVKLEGLRERAGLILLRDLLHDPHEFSQEFLKRMFDSFRGHPEMLIRMANECRNKSKPELERLLDEISGKSLIERIRTFWENVWDKLNSPGKELLQLMSVLRYPITMEALRAIMESAKEDEVRYDILEIALDSLADRSLVVLDASKQDYVLPGIIRPHIYSLMKHEERARAHQAAFDYYEQLCPNPKTLESMPEKFDNLDALEPLLESHYHLCKIGSYPTAFNRFFEEYRLADRLRNLGLSEALADACQALLPAIFNRDELVELRTKWEDEARRDNIYRRPYRSLPETAAAGSSEIRDLEKRTKVLYYLAHALASDQGRPRQAIVYYELIQDLIDSEYPESKPLPSQSESLLRIMRGAGTALSNMGESRKSIERYERALEITTDAEADQRALIQGYLCSENAYTGEFSEAYELGNKALESSRKLGERLVARNLTDMGISLLWEGKYDHKQEKIHEAIKSFVEAHELNWGSRATDVRNEGRTLIHLAEAYLELVPQVQEDEQREEYLNKVSQILGEALETNQKVGDIRRLAMCYSGYGQLHLASGNLVRAIESYKRAFTIYEDIGDVRSLATDAMDFGMFCQKSGYLSTALKWYEAAFSHWEHTRELIDLYLQNCPELQRKWRECVTERKDKQNWIFSFRESTPRFEISGSPDVQDWIGRDEFLKLCEHRFRTILLYGMGGIGKSYVAAKVIDSISIASEMRDELPFELVYWHSAHKPLELLLTGLEEALDTKAGPPQQPVIWKVIGLLANFRCLLVIDGLEDSVGIGCNSHETTRTAKAMSDEMERFLGTWCVSRLDDGQGEIRSQIICTGRHRPEAFNFPTGRCNVHDILPNEFYKLEELQRAFVCIPIEGMLREDGVELLRNSLSDSDRHKYDDMLLGRAVEQIDGHPLALKLLSNLINEGYALDNLLFAERGFWSREISNDLLNAVWNNLDDDEKTFLSRVSVYRHPESYEGWRSVIQLGTEERPPMKKDFQITLASLRIRSMIQVRQEATYGLHPIIQEYCYDKLTLEDRVKAHHLAGRRYKIRSPRPGTDWSQNRHGLRMFLESVYHACQAHEYHNAYKLFFDEYKLPAELRNLGFYQMLSESCQSMLPAVLGTDQVEKLPERWGKERILTSTELDRIGELFSEKGIYSSDFTEEICQELMSNWIKNEENLFTAPEVEELSRLWPAGSKLTENLLSPLQQSEILFYLGRSYTDRGRSRMAIPIYRALLDLVLKPLDHNEEQVLESLTRTYEALGIGFSNLGFSIPTIYYYSLGGRAAESVGNMKVASRCYGYLCMELAFLAQFGKAYEAGKKACGYLGIDQETKARALCDLGVASMLDAKFRNPERTVTSLALCFESTLLSIDAVSERTERISRSLGRCLIYLAQACVVTAVSRADKEREFYLQIAKKYALSALEFHTSKVGDRRRIANCLSLIGEVYLAQNDIPRAMLFYGKAFEIHLREVHNTRTASHDMIDLARRYDLQGNDAEANIYYRIALAKRPESLFLIKICIDDERLTNLKKEATKKAEDDLAKLMHAEQDLDFQALSANLRSESGLDSVDQSRFVEPALIKAEIMKDLDTGVIVDLLDSKTQVSEIKDARGALQQAISENLEKLV